MRVVVTGGAGFIGANVVERLVLRGHHDVVVLDDFSTGYRRNLADFPSVEIIEGSIIDPDALDTALAGAHAVIHLAARPSVPRSIEDPLATHNVNATGTLEVLEAARRCGSPHLIIASSSSVYGANPVIPKKEGLEPRPMSPYAASKLASESYAFAHAACFELPILVFRFFNVYGPKQPAGHAYAAAVPAFVAAALEGMALPIHGDGKQTRDFTFVGNVAEVLTTAIERGVTSSSPVNLAFGSRASLNEVVNVLEEILGTPLRRTHLPSRQGDVRDSQADNSLLRSLFSDARPVPLREGLQETIAWHQAEGKGYISQEYGRTRGSL